MPELLVDLAGGNIRGRYQGGRGILQSRRHERRGRNLKRFGKLLAAPLRCPHNDPGMDFFITSYKQRKFALKGDAGGLALGLS